MSESNTDPQGNRTYSVNELADEAGVTRRTVHYYISQGVLPASGAEGRGARYGRGHLDRLHLIRELQRDHLPLAEIRHRLEHLSDAEVAELLSSSPASTEPAASAFEYIQGVLAGTNRRPSAATGPSRAAILGPPAATTVPGAAPMAPGERQKHRRPHT
jgi:DNA-binding transcriptional MerR regulator